MKWYKPTADEIIFKGTEVLFENKQGVVTNHPQIKYNIPVCFKSNGAYDGWNLTKDELLIKTLDESDILDLGWVKTSESGSEYRSESGNWFLTLTFDKVYIREIYNEDMEVQVKNKMQLKLLMQFLGIAFQNL